MKKVWIPSKDTAWELVDVLSVGNETNAAERTLNVNTPLPAEGGGAGRLRTTSSVLQSTTMPYDPSHGISAELLHDLCVFNNLHEAPLVDGIHRRYKKDLIYTNIGSNLLVSVNPCKPIDAYDSIQPYLTGNEVSDEQKTEAPQPHIYSIANHALVEKKQGSSKRHTANQSIMVCGESGSGKTEASKYVMHFLLQADKEHQKQLNASTLTTLNTAFGGLSTSTSTPASTTGAAASTTMNKSPAVVAKGSAADIYSLSAVLGPSSVIFESFGNARTQHNDNSSRFGKYTKFQYSADHRLISAFTETFLLEQTRLVTVGEGEQNYHIFYALLNTKSEASKYKLTSAKDFKILCDGKNADNSSAGKGRNPASESSTADELECSLREVSEALRAVGVSAEEMGNIWSLLAALMHLGNIQCKSIVDESKPQADENYEQVELISPSMSLSELTYLLGVSSLTFEARVLTQRVQVGNRDSIHIKQLNATDVAHNIHALIKWIYSSLFTYIIKKVNYSHCSTVRSDAKAASFVGILDIFGFEVLGVNSLEQLCINYTNECLQQLFYQHVFDREQALYAEEGLTWSTIAYNNNQSVIDLIAKRPTGLLNTLEELSLLNRGQQDEGSLLAAYTSTHASNPLFERPRFGANTSKLFAVKHYAGSVTYSVTGFMDKNNDALQEDLLTLMMCSSNVFIQNAIVAVGMGTVTTDSAGQLGYVAEVPADKIVQGDGEGDEEGEPLPAAGNSSPPKRRGAGRRGSMNMATGPAHADAAAGKKLAAATTVSFQFRQQLEGLLRTLQGTQPHYVMCYKPNTSRQPNALDRVLLRDQLHYSGALEVVRIRQKGFPVSLSIEEFMTTYASLINANQGTASNKGKTAVGANDKAKALQYLAEHFAADGEFQVGKNRIFLRTTCHEKLQVSMGTAVKHTMCRFQALARKHIARKRFQHMRTLAIVLQAKIRMFLKRRKYQKEMAATVAEKLQAKRSIEQRNQETTNYEQRVLALHAACTAAEFNKVKDMLIKHPEDYFIVNWCRNNCTVLQSAILGGSLQIIQYMKPYPDELQYPDSEGNTAVHYAAKSAAPDRTEILRYFQFIIEPSYLKEISNVAATKGGQKYATVRPLQSRVQVPTLPKHMDNSGKGDGMMDEETATSSSAAGRISAQLLVKKAIEADSRQAVPGVTPGAVLKAGWLCKRGTKTASMWRKRWAILTTDALNYYHTEKDTVPRDSLPLRHKDCITVAESQVRAFAFDITMAQGAGTAGKAHEMITMLADNEKEMLEWMNLLTAVAGTDATPLRYTSVRTISPVVNEAFFSARNNQYESALHSLCGVGHSEAGNGATSATSSLTGAAAMARVELEKTLPATAAWLIHRGCPVNTYNLKGKSPLFLAIEGGRYHLGQLLMRYGATIPPHCGGKDRFLAFIDNEGSADRVIPALQFQPKPARLRNHHYLSLEILQHYVGSLSNFLDPDDAGSYFLTVTPFTAAHSAMSSAQYSQCPLIRLLPKPPSATTTGAVNISRTGTDSQLMVWYNQFHLPVPLENVQDGAYIVVELSKVITNTTATTTTTASFSSNSGGRQSTSRGGAPAAEKNNTASGAVTTVAWFQLKIDKEALNTSVLTIPFLKPPIIRNPVAQTTTTADAHQGNMHSVAMVETTLYRRNGKEAW